MNLWQHQIRAIESAREAILAGHKRICIVSPTGSGKGTISAEMLKLCVARGGKGVFLVQRREIIKDQAERLRMRGVDCGVILPGHNARPYADVQVCSIQTLTRRDHRPEANLIVWDECQHAPAKSWAPLLDSYPDAIVIGMTATPTRGDGRPLSQFQLKIEAAKYSELIRAGLIVPVRVFQPVEKMENALAVDPVAAYQQYAPGTKGFCFVASVDLGRDVEQRFNEAGIQSKLVTAKTNKRERDVAVDALKRGEIRMLVNHSVFTEGTDVTDAQTCILAGTVDSVGGYMQRVGRVMRSAPGKKYGILIDLVGASLSHGLPHIDRTWSLEGKSGETTSLPPLKVCEKCGYTQLAGRQTCEGCGWTFLREERKQPKIYSEALRACFDWEHTPESAKVDEFLRLVSESETRGFSIDWVIHAYTGLFQARPAVEWLAELPEARKRAEFDRWREFGSSKGFKAGYPAARYKECFGCWPPRSWNTIVQETGT